MAHFFHEVSGLHCIGLPWDPKWFSPCRRKKTSHGESGRAAGPVVRCFGFLGEVWINELGSLVKKHH